MADPNIPKNQQDAFPILTIAGATAPQTTTVIGGQVQKYWGPTDTGVNGVNTTTDANGHIFVVTNYLDLSGCCNGTMMIKRDNSIVNAPVVANGFIRFQYRTSKATTMPTSNLLGGVNFNLQNACGMTTLEATGRVFAAVVGTRTDFQYITVTWGPSATPGTPVISPVTIGSDMRIFFSFNSAQGALTNAPTANDFWSIAIWGSS